MALNYQSYQSVIYKNQLIMQYLLSGIKYHDTQKINDKKEVMLKDVIVQPATREKILDDYLRNKKNTDGRSISMILPMITYMVDGTTYSTDDKLQILAEFVDEEGISYTPVPYKLTFKCNIFSLHIDTLYQILEQLQLKFDPFFSLPIRYSPNSRVINQIFTLQTGGITIDIDFDVNSDRMCMFDFTIATDYILYKRKIPIPKYYIGFSEGENSIIEIESSPQITN